MEVAPEEFLWSSTASIIAGQQKYQRPLVENVRRYQYLCGTVFRELNLLTPEMVVLSTSTDRTAMPACPGYCIDGPEFILSWIPDTTLALGLRVSYHDVVVLSSDTDVPRMPVALHYLLAYGAAIQALEETKDAAEEIVDRYRRRWASVFGPEDGSTKESRAALAKYYRISQSRPIEGQNLGNYGTRRR